MVREKNKTRAKSKKISRVKIFLVVRVFEILGSAILCLSAPKKQTDICSRMNNLFGIVSMRPLQNKEVEGRGVLGIKGASERGGSKE